MSRFYAIDAKGHCFDTEEMATKYATGACMNTGRQWAVAVEVVTVDPASHDGDAALYRTRPDPVQRRAGAGHHRGAMNRALVVKLSQLLGPVRDAWLAVPERERAQIALCVVELANRAGDLIRACRKVPNADQWAALAPSAMMAGKIVQGYGDEGLEALEAAAGGMLPELEFAVQRARVAIIAALGVPDDAPAATEAPKT